VLQLRNTDRGRAIGQYVYSNISKNRLGLNVPVPEEAKAKRKMEEAEAVLGYLEKHDPGKEKRQKLLGAAYKLLLEALAVKPQLFKGERVYLWESIINPKIINIKKYRSFQVCNFFRRRWQINQVIEHRIAYHSCIPKL
jgi:hypothetical protein